MVGRKKQSTEADLDITEVMELTDKDFQTAT